MLPKTFNFRPATNKPDLYPRSVLAGTEVCEAKPCFTLPRREVTELSSTPVGHPAPTGCRCFPVSYQIYGWGWGFDP